MNDNAETLVQGIVRVLAILGLILTGLGAAVLFAAVWTLIAAPAGTTREYFGEPTADADLLLLGPASAFMGACVAIYGLVKRSRVTALVGAAGQALGAILFLYALEIDPEDGDDLTTWRVLLALVILLDLAVVFSAWHIQRRVGNSPAR
jgi:hypothetical protein